MDVESPNSAASRISNAQNSATKAERDAAERVTAAQKRVRDADREAQVQVDHLRDVYAKRAESERGRGEAHVESIRNNTYENLVDVRRRGETEEARIARENDQDVKAIAKKYEHDASTAAERGERKLREETQRNAAAAAYEKSRGTDEIERLKTKITEEKSALHFEREVSHQALAKSAQEARTGDEERTRASIQDSKDHYQGVYEGALKQTKDAVGDVNWRAAREIDRLRQETSLKLDAYSSQKSDPFYRLVNMDAALVENEDQFVLTARVPSHEREHININLRGNEIVISGKRRSNETLEVEPGRVQRTSAYQTYSESFPLTWPVNPKNMTREWEGDTLVVRLPKRSTYEAPRAKKVVAQAIVERPNFPKNLPTSEELAAANADPEKQGTPPSRRKKAGSVLG